MPVETDDFRTLMKRVCDGSEDAAWELVEKYGDAIRRAVRRALNKNMRSQFDSLDFVQLVWSSFFRARDRLNRFERPVELVAFLGVMARNKVVMEVRRRLSTEKYNLNRERSLNEFPVSSQVDKSGQQPAPIDVAIAREQWSRMLQNQPRHYQRIIQLRLQGRTYHDIADSLDLAECTVRRFLKKLLKERVV